MQLRFGGRGSRMRFGGDLRNGLVLGLRAGLWSRPWQTAIQAGSRDEAF